MILPNFLQIIRLTYNQLFNLLSKYIITVIPSIIIFSSLAVILLPNPMHALIALIFVFLATALLLLTLNLKFLGFIYLIIYIGAIAILFLFVIMLFNLRTLNKSIRFNSFRAV